MINIIRDSIVKNKLLIAGEKVIVALSGGADSVCLLHALFTLRDELNITVIAAHVNHCLRGEESDRDEAFAHELCNKYGIELFIKRADVKALAEEQKIGLELCGRNVRYAFFEELSEKHVAKIATAHTANDNLETCLFNLVRGSGIRGVSGIPSVRGNIIRPMLGVTREQIEHYAAVNELKFVTDSSNLSNDYTRNKIRNQIVPLLKDINPNLENTVMRFSGQAQELCEFLDSFAEEKLSECRQENGYSCEKLCHLSETLLKHAVNLMYKKITGTSLEEKHVLLCCRVIREKNGAVNLPGFYDGRVYKNSVFLIKKT